MNDSISQEYRSGFAQARLVYNRVMNLRHNKELLLTFGIILLLSFYTLINVPKIKEGYQKIARWIVFRDQLKQTSRIASIDIGPPETSIHRTYVKDTIVTQEGKNIIFVEIPSSLQLEHIKSYIRIDGVPVINAQIIAPHILYIPDKNLHWFIINDDYKRASAHIISNIKQK